jgi:hypothetical protein
MAFDGFTHFARRYRMRLRDGGPCPLVFANPPKLEREWREVELGERELATGE